MSDCLFCKIISGEIPSFKVYEDDDVLAFLDITPLNPGHTLVVPKKHYATMLDIPEDLLVKVTGVVKKLSLAVTRAVNSDSFNIFQNNGPVSGQAVDHFHFHIVPRFEDDGYKLWHGREYSEGEADKVLKKIVNNIK